MSSAMTHPVDQTSVSLLAPYTQQQREIVYTNLSSVVGGAEDKLRGSIVSRADVRDIGLVLHENLCASEIAELQYTAGWIQEQILGLDVSMAYAL